MIMVRWIFDGWTERVLIALVRGTWQTQILNF